MNFENWYRTETHSTVDDRGIGAVLELHAEGATVPFIARYRKERTGNLDEVQIQSIIETRERWDELIKRKVFVLGEIEKQGKLSTELKKSIESCFSPDLLEDLYLPYKLKKKTKATVAKEAGLEPLADWIWNRGHVDLAKNLSDKSLALADKATQFLNPEKNIATQEAALAGALDILVERLAETLELREYVRERLQKDGMVLTKKGTKAKTPSKFENYFEFSESVSSLLEAKNSHRYLALRRGWLEEELSVSLSGRPDPKSFEASLIAAFEKEALSKEAPEDVATLLRKAAKLALNAHVLPALENQIHKQLKDQADAAAIQVFSENVRELLMASPFGSKAVLGVDPGLRTGSKAALVDESGKYVMHLVLYLQSPSERLQAKGYMLELLKKIPISAIAVGNGTAGRETESFLKECVKDSGVNIPVVMVSEAGASVYSASAIAREEFADLDVSVRGAISIARRLQDPLAELVKVDPKSIGVGQYQHDVSQPALKKSLEFVVDSCVNRVGVNLNTASEPLLAHVSGIGTGLSKSIVEHRTKNGLFKSREDLLSISRFTKKAYEQAAGFLRIHGGGHPLDNTGVHPERYPVLELYIKRHKLKYDDIIGPGAARLKSDETLKAELGEFTFADVVAELEKPGRDPREAFVPFSFRDDISEIKDLKEGMVCPGIVTNVTNFGAFVDIGVHQDGLVHLSQLADRFIKDPHEVVKPGDRVTVRVLGVELAKNQISLTMRSEVKPEAMARPPREDRAPRDERGARNTGGRGGGPHSQGRRNEGPRRDSPSRPNFENSAPRAAARFDQQKSHSDGGAKGGGFRPSPKGPPRIDPNSPFAKLAAIRDQLKKN